VQAVRSAVEMAMAATVETMRMLTEISLRSGLGR
jgi:hypothetical protein